MESGEHEYTELQDDKVVDVKDDMIISLKSKIANLKEEISDYEKDNDDPAT